MTMAEEIEAVACKFVVHIPTNTPDRPDVHLIKETVKYKDGRIEPRLRFIKDYQRPYWITNRDKRNHRDKKEWESKDNVTEFWCTQSQLKHFAARRLNMRLAPRDTIKDVATSPYLYGTNIPSTSLIKADYAKKYPDFSLPYSICAFDIETDMINGTRKMWMATAIFGTESVTVVDKSFFQGYHDPIGRLKTCFQSHLGEYIEKHGLTAEFILVDDEIEMMREIFKRIHAWQPDFLNIWNMDFDIGRIMERLKDLGVDPGDILCDPRVPKAYRVCEYRPGPNKKKTASGKHIPINPASRWHTLHLTASFYVIDSMCTYKYVRQQSEQEQSSYSLDNILAKEKLPGKLKFKGLDGLEYAANEKWHILMQSKYPFEYTIYNIFDCFAMLLLDNKTQDLRYTIGAGCGVTDFEKYNSQPTRIADAFYFDLLEAGQIMGSTGRIANADGEDVDQPDPELEPDRDAEEEADDIGEDDDSDDSPVIEAKTLDLRDWVLTLPSHYSAPGLCIIEEDPTIFTLYRTHVFDSDEVGAYPSATEAANVSRTTCKREVIAIEGIEETTFRLQNLNLVLGKCNAIEYCTNMFGLKPATDMLTEYQNSLN